MRKLKGVLRNDIEGIPSVVEEGYEKPLLRLSVKCKLTNEELRGELDDLETEGWELEYTGGRKNLLRYTLHID